MTSLKKLLEGLFVIVSGIGFGATYITGLVFFLMTNNYPMIIFGAVGVYFIVVAMKVGEATHKNMGE